MTTYGIDVSKHQKKIDWSKVKASGKVQFAILRAGLGRLASQKDETFERNYADAKAAGIPIGAYWYSYALTPQEAEQEADACIQSLQRRFFALLVVRRLLQNFSQRKNTMILPKKGSRFFQPLAKYQKPEVTGN